MYKSRQTIPLNTIKPKRVAVRKFSGELCNTLCGLSTIVGRFLVVFGGLNKIGINVGQKEFKDLLYQVFLKIFSDSEGFSFKMCP
jgi:hypothetical protein